MKYPTSTAIFLAGVGVELAKLIFELPARESNNLASMCFCVAIGVALLFNET